MGRNVGNQKHKSMVVRFRYLFLVTFMLVGCSFLLNSMENIDLFLNGIQRSAPKSEWYTIDTEGCTIPAMDPLDDSVKSFMVYPSNIPHCPHASHPLLGSSTKRIWIRTNTFQYYKINQTDKVTCCYRHFFRPSSIEDVESIKIDDRSKYSFCVYFNDVIEVQHEFVHVSCSDGRKKIYEQYFLFPIRKEFSKHHSLFKDLTANKTAYNVLVLGIDAVSRLNFHRTMPNTANYLAKKGAIEFLGYNKVGDNTFPNLIPMLMGLKVSELKRTCHPYPTATFDNCPFIWQWFKQAGYYTALGEDAPNIGTFNYVKTGFAFTPTDYYLHTFMKEAATHVGAKLDFNTYLCMQDKYFYKVLLDYIESLTRVLRDKRLFGFFWEITMSHDYLNYPMKMDNDYLEFFFALDSSGYLNETIVMLVSDHGIRWGPIRDTKQGRLEERLPFVHILLPESFRNKYTSAYQNMILNSKRLVTPFDVHATLYDLLDVSNVENNIIFERSNKHYWNNRSISLFLPVPGNRTCEVAEIDDHWCTCHKEVSLKKDNAQALEAAKMLVVLINDMLKPYTQCAKLNLTEVVEVTEVKVGEAGSEESTWIEFMVVVKTSPGGAIFEATLRQDGDNNSWKLLGTPSRINLYGDQSRCVDNYQMKLYCYCR